jgi:hypothetical protein
MTTFMSVFSPYKPDKVQPSATNGDDAAPDSPQGNSSLTQYWALRFPLTLRLAKHNKEACCERAWEG